MDSVETLGPLNSNPKILTGLEKPAKIFRIRISRKDEPYSPAISEDILPAEDYRYIGATGLHGDIFDEEALDKLSKAVKGDHFIWKNERHVAEVFAE